MLPPIIERFCLFQRTCAKANTKVGLEKTISNTIEQACDNIITGTSNNQISLDIWQTTSGTQTNTVHGSAPIIVKIGVKFSSKILLYISIQFLLRTTVKCNREKKSFYK